MQNIVRAIENYSLLINIINHRNLGSFIHDLNENNVSNKLTPQLFSKKAQVIHHIATDASNLAWGVIINNLSLSGHWLEYEKSMDINGKELLAVFKILQQAPILNLYNTSLLLQSDNRTVVALLKDKVTRSRYLMNLKQEILDTLIEFQIQLNAYYIPGMYNCEADRLSRMQPLPEWHLLPLATDKIFHKWGVPQIDLFASRNAHVVPDYSTLDPRDKNAIFHDALSEIWNYEIAWLFPPPYLIPRVLHHLDEAKGTYLIVVPRWKKMFWYCDLKRRALAPPYILSDLKNALIDISIGAPPPKVENMILEVWKCKGGLIVDGKWQKNGNKNI